jgi:hypothetical protein
MKRSEVREILATHADQLIGLRAVPSRTPTRNDQVGALLDLAEQLQAILVPVEPSANFRRRLQGELLLETQRRQIEPAPNLFQQHRKGILIGAAAVGSVASVMGVIIAFVLHLRHGRATHTATS